MPKHSVSLVHGSPPRQRPARQARGLPPGAVPHWVKLVQSSHAVPAALQTWPPVQPLSVLGVHVRPGGGGGPGGGPGGDTERVQVPLWQVPIEQSVPFGLRLALAMVFFVFFFFLHSPHFFLHLASASSGAANPRVAATAPTASPRRAARRVMRLLPRRWVR